MIPSTNDYQKSYKKKKKEKTSTTFAKKCLNINILMIKAMAKVRTIVIMLVNKEVLCIAYVILTFSKSEEILVVFHDGLNHDYHFIIKQVAKEFEVEFNSLGDNTKKYKTFSVPVTKKVKRVDENGRETIKTISFRLQFIDSARLKGSSLSNVVNNRAEGIRKTKIYMDMIIANVKRVDLNTKIVSAVLNRQTLNIMIY